MPLSTSENRPVNLIVERLDRGLTTNGAAKAMGIHRGSLLAAESGERVHPATAKKIADFYGYRVTEVWPVEDAA